MGASQRLVHPHHWAKPTIGVNKQLYCDTLSVTHYPFHERETMAVKKQAEEKPATTELTVQQRHDVSVRERFSDDDLRKVDSFEAAMSLAIQAYGNVESVTDMELGNGFKLIKGDDLERLIGVSF